MRALTVAFATLFGGAILAGALTTPPMEIDASNVDDNARKLESFGPYSIGYYGGTQVASVYTSKSSSYDCIWTVHKTDGDYMDIYFTGGTYCGVSSGAPISYYEAITWDNYENSKSSETSGANGHNEYCVVVICRNTWNDCDDVEIDLTCTDQSTPTPPSPTPPSPTPPSPTPPSPTPPSPTPPSPTPPSPTPPSPTPPSPTPPSPTPPSPTPSDDGNWDYGCSCCTSMDPMLFGGNGCYSSD
ncbi:hypothetical protein TrVE_jg12080 [Triparma verrucosa]|uniref:Uncharacterized protein n=1 Tax=Triparma verrucosa TaxID=1606542 RepID=A0A9W7EWG7_9STRA|nr:hypothetical protein TrVE_jg12080 [Triparma verrucosa]